LHCVANQSLYYKAVYINDALWLGGRVTEWLVELLDWSS